MAKPFQHERCKKLDAKLNCNGCILHCDWVWQRSYDGKQEQDPACKGKGSLYILDQCKKEIKGFPNWLSQSVNHHHVQTILETLRRAVSDSLPEYFKILNEQIMWFESNWPADLLDVSFDITIKKETK